MANGPPFATLNHFADDLGIASESQSLRFGINHIQASTKSSILAANVNSRRIRVRA
jgi:hypothetical protein